MSAQVYYNNANEGAAVVPVTFLSLAGVATDPSSISCVVTDPTGATTTYTYGGSPPNNTITRTSAGNYALNITGLVVAGLYVTTWIGTGNNVQQISPYTFRLVPLSDVGTGMQFWYTGREELKSRLGITDSTSDYEMQLAIQAVTNWINAYCVVPETPVLTADLTWVPAGELTEGDELVGFDEYPVGPSRPKRHFRRAVVTAAPRRRAACTKITLEDGREVVSAADHRWLARSGTGKTGTVYQWFNACAIQPGYEIASPVRAWPDGQTFEDGWMSGILDGEGWVHRARLGVADGGNQRNGTGAHLGIAQNAGPVLDRVYAYLKSADIPYNTQGRGYDACQRVEICQRWAAMELMGRLQPTRLLPLAHELWENGHISRKGPDSSARVVSVESAGIREVVSIGTTTGTYIANGLASHNCGRHFYQMTEARTYCPTNIWELPVDDLVSTPSVVSSVQVKVDYDGDGIFETSWTQGVNYQLKLGTPGNWQDNYNVNAAGVPRPYRQLQVLMGTPGSNSVGGGWLPFIWPYTHLDRVQITGTWGWNTIPPNISQASLLLCTDLFKSKDAPWGIAGTAETGLMRVQSNPWAVELLHDYVNTRRKVGVLFVLNVLCAYTDLRPETKKALGPWNPEYVDVSLSPQAYWSAVRERWTGERDLVNVEHDVIVHERVVPEFAQCDRLWCTFPYPCAQGGFYETAAGCARYSKYLQRLIPVAEIERAVHWAYCDCPPECSPGICWHHMDAYLVEAFQRHDVSVHLHEGAVGHV